MPTASINGIDLFYTSSGQGTPIVFAHGVGGNHASWHYQTPFFSRWYQVLAIDHRGFGNTTDVPDSPGRFAFVDDLEGLLDHLGIEKTVLVAQSMGGWTCLGFALRHPDRVLALVMADSLGNISTPGRLQERLAEVRGATENLSQADRVVSKAFQEREPGRTQLYLNIASFNASNRFNLRGGPSEPATTERLAQLKMPVLFIVGEHDVLVPPDVVELGHQLVPGAKMAMIPDAGHSAYFERPDAFNQVVYHFLREAGLGAAAVQPVARAAAAAAR